MKNKNFTSKDYWSLPDDNRAELTSKGCEGAPDLIVEIVSPSSRKMDYIIKNGKYAEAGVLEYWIQKKNVSHFITTRKMRLPLFILFPPSLNHPFFQNYR